MKSWEYYNENPHAYPRSREFKDKLLADIANQRLTEAERQAALADVPRHVNERIKAAAAPYNAHAAKLEAEFWDDAREELGYEKFLLPAGVSALEYEAYQHGHSAGFCEIYGCLCDLSALAKVLVENKK